jgi:predicted transcriptional regulator
MQTHQIDTALQLRLAQLNNTQKESLLKLIDSFIEEGIDVKAYSEDLEKANREIENGDFVMHEEAVQIINGSK